MQTTIYYKKAQFRTLTIFSVVQICKYKAIHKNIEYVKSKKILLIMTMNKTKYLKHKHSKQHFKKKNKQSSAF